MATVKQYKEQNNKVYTAMADKSLSTDEKQKILESFLNETMLRMVVSLGLVFISLAFMMFSHSADNIIGFVIGIHLVIAIVIVGVVSSFYLKASNIRKRSD